MPKLLDSPTSDAHLCNINYIKSNLMAYSVVSPNGEESLNKFLSPDPDHIRGGPSHGDDTSCIKKSSQSV